MSSQQRWASEFGCKSSIVCVCVACVCVYVCVCVGGGGGGGACRGSRRDKVMYIINVFSRIFQLTAGNQHLQSSSLNMLAQSSSNPSAVILKFEKATKVKVRVLSSVREPLYMSCIYICMQHCIASSLPCLIPFRKSQSPCRFGTSMKNL